MESKDAKEATSSRAGGKRVPDRGNQKCLEPGEHRKWKGDQHG